ncbi:hypothetical protein B0T13DRAFT_532472 [Neurospora crassa]|nr:hypothetical protein B0T13DRAFT_532472 [Neurospora crassa]
MKFSGLLLVGAALIVLAHEKEHIIVDEANNHAYDHKACGPEGLGDDSLRSSAADILATGETDALTYYAGNSANSHPQEDPNTSPGHNWSRTNPCFNSIFSNDAFCVFTSTSYANDEGISFITTAQRAAYLTSLLSFTPHSNITSSPEKYTISSIPGKGLGLIASTRIPRGSVILSSHPTLLIDYRVFDELPRIDYISLQAAAISSLPPAHRSAFFNLSTQSNNASVTGGLSRIALTDTIITTNAFDIPAPPPRPWPPSPPSSPPHDQTDPNDALWYTVFASSISRHNHDCRPNADFRFDWNSNKGGPGLVQVITAVKDILPGEEITISYINPLGSRKARQKLLSTAWGFECSCELCSRSGGRVEEADRRVRLIRKVRRLLKEGQEGGSNAGREEEGEGWKMGSREQGEGDDRTKAAESLVSLYEMEGLWGMVHEAYALAAREYSKAGETWMVMKWAALAVEFGTMVLGEGDEALREMKGLARNPWGHGGLE